MNPMVLLQMQQRFAQFQQDHPKFMPFCGAVRDSALQEGTVIDVKVTPPDGKSLATNIRLTANDVETIRMLLNSDANL
ncbi:MAG: hypothetical protein K6G16_00150 [Lachnospiraceae bacterium]|nr:hypothetical protein [Lachnospiraceae bacterium]